MIRTVIVDDEAPARDRLRQMLGTIGDVQVVGEAQDGEQALQRIEGLRPDLVFLDIQMPGRNGLEVAATLPAPRPRIIFCTAFDQYAVKAFDLHALDYLLKPVNRARLAAAVERVRRPMLEQQAWRREIETATDVQVRMFPGDLPFVKGIDYAGSCREALGIGGDYYDVLPLPGDRLGLALGDVSGKGIAAALLMAGLQGRLQSLASAHLDRVATLLTDINRLMSSPEGTRYISFFYAVFDQSEGLLTYSNAGHPPPLLLRGGEGDIPALARLNAGGTVLGLFPDTAYEQQAVPVGTGDILVMYSDGVSEATDDSGEEFGDERLVETILRCRHSNAPGLRDQILAEVSRYTKGVAPHDDRTLVVAKFC